MSAELNEAARIVMSTAAEFAREQGSEVIETEHVLLALLSEARREIGPLLPHPEGDDGGHSGVDELRRQVEERMPSAGEFVPRGRIPKSPIVQSAIDFATEEALRDGEPLVSPSHLLLGLSREERGLAAAVLHEAGLTPEAIRERIDARRTAADVEKTLPLVDGKLSPAMRFELPEPTEARGINGSSEGLVESLLELDQGMTYREFENDARVYVPRNEGWTAHVKAGWDKMYCYLKFPGDDAFHLILNGEVFLQRSDEKYCLTCALRHGFATRDRLYWQRLNRKKS